MRTAGRFLDPDLFARTYRDPLALISLCVDLLPFFAIFAFGWGATPLVALYWLENLVIGVVTLARMLGAFLANMTANAMALFLGPFFVVHYGLFCYGHGVFLQSFASENGFGQGADETLGNLINWALASGLHMPIFVLAIILINALFYAVDFIGKGEVKRVNVTAEMFAPYGRIVTLHVAIILGAGLALALGEPLLGVVLLIALRVAFGIVVSMFRRRRLEQREVGIAGDV